MNPWLGILIVLVSLGALLGACQFIFTRLVHKPELARKSVHMGMGALCACFPLLFKELWPVFLLCVLAIGGLSAIRLIPVLRTNIGSSLHSVKRFSLGELYFPIAVAVVWFISFDKTVIYCTSVLVLALADASAALVGSRYGIHQYSTKEGHKTWEGSIVFFSVTFFCIHIPLLLYTNTGRSECLIIAAVIAILVMIFEATAWSGLDNLLIPISVCILLNVYEDFTTAQMIGRLWMIIAFMGAFLSLKRYLKLDDASLLGSSLFLYLAYNIGGWQWVLAPMVMFVSYLSLGPWKINKDEKVHNIHSLLSVIAPGFIWLVLYYRLGDEHHLIYYNLTFAVELGLIFIAQWAWQRPSLTLPTILFISSILSSMLIIVPFHFFNEIFLVKTILISCAVSLLGCVAFITSQEEIRDCPLSLGRWIRQGVIGFGISLIPWGLSL